MSPLKAQDALEAAARCGMSLAELRALVAEDRMLRPGQAAEICGVNTDTIQRYIHEIGATRVGCHLRIAERDLRAWLKRNAVGVIARR